MKKLYMHKFVKRWVSFVVQDISSNFKSAKRKKNSNFIYYTCKCGCNKR